MSFFHNDWEPALTKQQQRTGSFKMRLQSLVDPNIIGTGHFSGSQRMVHSTEISRGIGENTHFHSQIFSHSHGKTVILSRWQAYSICANGKMTF